jgi:hypothetical protein
MNKKTGITVAITVLVTLILANKLKALPGLNKLPTV